MDINLDEALVDTLVAVFHDGYLGGVFYSILPLGGVFTVLAVIGLLSHAVKHS